jgi:hypothetical protein
MKNTTTKSRTIKNSINLINELTSTKEVGPLHVNTTETLSFGITTLENSTNIKALPIQNIKFTKDQMNAPFTLKINNVIKECEYYLNTTLRLMKDAAIQTFTTENNQTLMKGLMYTIIGCTQFRKAIQILTVIEEIPQMIVREIGNKEDHAVVIEVLFLLIHKPEHTNNRGTIKSLTEMIANTCLISGNPGANQEIK